MDELTRAHRADVERAAMNAGVPAAPTGRPTWDAAAAIHTDGELIAAMQSWPVQPSGRHIQDQVTGQLHFIPGISVPGSSDLLVE